MSYGWVCIYAPICTFFADIWHQLEILFFALTLAIIYANLTLYFCQFIYIYSSFLYVLLYFWLISIFLVSDILCFFVVPRSRISWWKARQCGMDLRGQSTIPDILDIFLKKNYTHFIMITLLGIGPNQKVGVALCTLHVQGDTNRST